MSDNYTSGLLDYLDLKGVAIGSTKRTPVTALLSDIALPEKIAAQDVDREASYRVQDLINKVADIRKPQEGFIRLYNAGLKERDPGGWLEPHISEWVKEVAEGAGDVPVEDITSPLIYMSDAPTWVDMIVGRKLKKHPSDVTEEEIREHGRLNILDFDKEVENEVYSLSSEDYEDLYSHTGRVIDILGNEREFYDTGLYDEGDIYTGEGRRVEMPVGPESSDYISAESQQIIYSLVGDELLEFLRQETKGK